MGDKSKPKILGYVLVYREREVLTRTGKCRAWPGAWGEYKVHGRVVYGMAAVHELFAARGNAEAVLTRMDRDAREYWRKTKTSFACRQAKHVAVEGFVVPVEAPQ